MKADDLGMKLLHEVAHFVVEWSASWSLNRRILIKIQLNIVRIQVLSPVQQPCVVLPRRALTEEIRVDGTRGSSADAFEFFARLFHAQ